MPRNRRSLVVDADIAASAGTAQTADPRSSTCRAVLDEIRSSDQRIVMSDALFAEWRRHMSIYSLRWLRSMEQSKRVIRLGDDVLPDLMSLLYQCACAEAGDNRAGIMRKDIHLIETALAPAADKTVVSGDNRVLRHLLVHTRCDPRIGRVVWVSATIDEHQCLEWLKAGAKNERARQLRTQAADAVQT